MEGRPSERRPTTGQHHAMIAVAELKALISTLEAACTMLESGQSSLFGMPVSQVLRSLAITARGWLPVSADVSVDNSPC